MASITNGVSEHSMGVQSLLGSALIKLGGPAPGKRDSGFDETTIRSTMLAPAISHYQASRQRLQIHPVHETSVFEDHKALSLDLNGFLVFYSMTRITRSNGYKIEDASDIETSSNIDSFDYSMLAGVKGARRSRE